MTSYRNQSLRELQVMKNIFLFIFLAGTFLLSGAENLFLNSSFEKNTPLQKRKWRMTGLDNWELLLNSGVKKCEISLVSPGHTGKYALRLHTLGKTGFCAAQYSKTFPVEPGAEVSFNVRMKGRGKGYVRFYLWDKKGRKLKKTFTKGQPASEKWELMQFRFALPREAAAIQAALETYRDNADVLFDDAELFITSGDLLENDLLSVRINRRTGGVVDSFLVKGRGVDLTTPATLAKEGGFMDSVLPEKRAPGVLAKNTFERISAAETSRTYRFKLTEGPFSGLEVTRKYELPPASGKLLVTETFLNTSSKPMILKRRIRNFVSSAKGCYSYPTPDWVTLYHQSSAPLNGLNAVAQDLFRAGWIAKHYEKEKLSLVFHFPPTDVRRLYTYFCEFPAFSTIEWYCRPAELAPGQKRVYKSAIEVIREETLYYADALGKKQNTEVVKPVNMPPPSPADPLPPHFKDYFPYCSNLGNLNLPAMTGDLKQNSATRRYVLLTDRLMDELVESYVDTISTGRMHTGAINKEFCTAGKGKHLAGEKARRLKLKLVFANLYLNRKDVDIKKYMKEKWPKYKAMLEDPHTQAFLKNYKDCFAAAFTADEIQPQNADIMLKVHKELKKYLPEQAVPLPYLNSSASDLIPYLPVFIGDFYPVKRRQSSDRNPWAVYQEFTNRVRKAGKVPVWFMPQGFSSTPDNYAFPTPGEIRLMLYLSVCAGVKGIAWHGFPSGTWPWMMNYHMYRYAMLGGAGQRSPSWPGVRDGGRFFAFAGPLLVNAAPAALPAGAEVTCGEYRSQNHYYAGKAIRLFALKHPWGMIYMAVNQNPYGREKGILQLPQAGFDLNLLCPVGKRIALDLAPGDCKAVFTGAKEALDVSFRSLFRAERARYLLLADRLKGDGILMASPDKFAVLKPEQALRTLLKARADAEKMFARTPAAAVSAKFDECRRLLDAVDFRLCCALEAAVTPDMIKKTRRYAAWCPHPDPEFNTLRTNLKYTFAEFYRLYDLIRKGSGVMVHKNAIEALYRKVRKECASVHAYLDKRKQLIDDPYEGHLPL